MAASFNSPSGTGSSFSAATNRMSADGAVQKSPAAAANSVLTFTKQVIF